MKQRSTEIGFYAEDLWRLHLGRRKAMAWNSDTGNVGWEACSDPFWDRSLLFTFLMLTETLFNSFQFLNHVTTFQYFMVLSELAAVDSEHRF